MMYGSDSDEEPSFHWSDEEEDTNNRPTHGQKRGKRRRKAKKAESVVDDGWSDGDEEDEDEDDIVDDIEDEDSAEVAESLIGTEFSLLAQGETLKVVLG